MRRPVCCCTRPRLDSLRFPLRPGFRSWTRSLLAFAISMFAIAGNCFQHHSVISAWWCQAAADRPCKVTRLTCPSILSWRQSLSAIIALYHSTVQYFKGNNTEFPDSPIDGKFFLRRLPFVSEMDHPCFSGRKHSFDGHLLVLRSQIPLYLNLPMPYTVMYWSNNPMSSLRNSSHCGVHRFPQRPQSSRPL